MNPLEARRLLLADPHRSSAELRAALDESPSLATFRVELLRSDEQLHDALTATEVPGGLADRLVLQARYHERSRWGLALAAALVSIAVGIPPILEVFHEPQRYGLERAMIEHVDEEAGELQDDGGVEPAVLRASVGALGVQLKESGYRIRHLGHCVVAGREGRHFTIDGPNGVVSFVVLPGAAKEDAGVLMRAGATRGVFMKRAGVTIGAFVQDATERAELEGLLRRVFV
jgi:hypothetical protein